jgi:cell shape-determining protein MreC
MSRRSLWAGIVLVLLLVVGGSFLTPPLNGVRNRLWIQWSRLFTPDEGSITDPHDSEQLLAENIRLKAELKDYAELRKQLGTPSFADFTAVPAAIIGRPLDTFRSEFIVSKGKNDGVQSGAPVLINGSKLIGFITTVNDDTAICQLLVHPSITQAVEIIGEEGSQPPQGLLQGKHYTSLELNTVPRDQTLKKGQAVVSMSKPGLVPSGLFIASIREVIRPENDVYQKALLQLPYDPDYLRAVTILTPR